MIKTFIISFLGLTTTTVLLILLSRIRDKPLKSCGETCKCFDDNNLELGL
jgi:hypothetical protein